MLTTAGNTVRGLVGELPIGWQQHWAGRPLAMPVYHAAGDVQPEHLRHLRCWRDARTLERDLDFFLRHFTPVGLGAASGERRGGSGGRRAEGGGREQLPPNAMHLTIDDGLREAAEVIAPMCLRKGIAATFFLTTDFLDNRSLGYRHLSSLLVERIAKMPAARQVALQADLAPLFRGRGLSGDDLPAAILAVDYPRRKLLDLVAEKIELDVGDYLRTERPYLERSEVSKLIAQGFTVGAHSVDHPRFALISEDEQRRQVTESMARICEWFDPPQKVFAFPFDAGGVAPELSQQLQEDGTVDAFFGVDWRLPGSQRPLIADRVPMDADSERPARRILGEVYAKNIVSGWRRKRATSGERRVREPPAAQPALAERQS